MTTTQIGKIGESKVLTKFLELGYEVYVPFGDGNLVDLVVNINGQLKKIQVKTSANLVDGKIIFSLGSTVNGKKHSYSNIDFDYFALVCLELDKILLLELNENSPKVQINFQLTPSTNKQSRYIEDYDIEKVLGIFV